MISRRNRFRGHHSVSRVRGSLLHSTNFSLRFAPNQKKDHRLAVVVSKKIDKRAVVRNRIRRRLYEVFRTQGLLNNTPIDVVLYVKKVDVAGMLHKALEAEIKSLTNKALLRK